jgi:tocopherol cyclase
MLQSLQSLFHPDQYQGWGKSKKYFEGWYFKVVNADESKALAFIPGIAMDEHGLKQAFVQILDGKKRTAAYHKFDAADFKPEANKFELSISQNYFSNEVLRLHLPTAMGELHFSDRTKWPSTFYSPGIMGPYSFVPFMECYHGILSMDHRIEGVLQLDDESVDFTNGRGYMEKDWGKSFPSAYFWMQTNHFSQPGISLKASVAKIPWMGRSFIGFIAGIWLQDRLIQFTTYNASKLIQSMADEKEVRLVMENKNFKLEILAHRETSTQLASPILGLMDGRIEESMTSLIDVQLFDKKNRSFLLNDVGRNAGLEVAGKVKQLTLL